MTGLEILFIGFVSSMLILQPLSPLEKVAKLERLGKPVPSELRKKAVAEANQILAGAEMRYNYEIEKEQKRIERKLKKKANRLARQSNWVSEGVDK